ncbi:LuxR C-terminal-related transcriptional regulator [Nocardiopsis synnemataformans]|uniref:LuxR C-terminal-related transcriptional regulator n=1 Tax=Nocardiopsis synnemataformans TaxID=61305 RepID=UPI003EB72612
MAIHVGSEVIHQGLIAMLRSAPTRYEIVPFDSIGFRAEKLMDKPPNVVILGCGDEQVADIEELAQRSWSIGSKILLLLPRSDDRLFDSVAKLSTDGFLIMDLLTTEVLDDSLQNVAKGDVVIPRPIAGRLLARTRGGQGHARPQLPELTPRETQALQLLVRGLSNKQIATQLQISSHGVKRLVANLLAKLNCKNRTMAVAMALQWKLVEKDTAADA